VNMATQILTPKPQPEPAEPAVVHYLPLGDLTQLVPSKSGHFWCYSHLADLPLNEQSPDPRFCNSCHGVLMAEYRDMVTTRGKRKPWWVPVNSAGSKTTPHVQEQGALIMSTVNDKKPKWTKLTRHPRMAEGENFSRCQSKG